MRAYGLSLSEPAQRAFASYETPLLLANFLARRAINHPSPVRGLPFYVVDPTCGSGRLLAAAQQWGGIGYGVELDPATAKVAAQLLRTPLGGRIKVGNALIDPVPPLQWPEFISRESATLKQVAQLRLSNRWEMAEVLTQPLRNRLKRSVPEELWECRPFCWPLEFPEVFLGGGFHGALANPPWDKLKLQIRECFEPSLRRLHESEQRSVRNLRLAGASEQQRHDVAVLQRRLKTMRQYLKLNLGPSTGDTNTYLATLTLISHLLASGGRLGAIVPIGLWTDLGATVYREDLFERFTSIATWGLDAKTDAFPQIDQRVAVLVAHSRAPGELPCTDIRVHGSAKSLAELETQVGVKVAISLIRTAAPQSSAIPALDDPLDESVLRQIYATALAFGTGGWAPRFAREVDLTADAEVFDGVQMGAPLWEGKRIGAYELCPVDAVRAGHWPSCKAYCTRAANCPFQKRNGHQLWVDESRLGRRNRNHSSHIRVAWRSIARADRARRMEATLVPAGYRLGNSLNYIEGDGHTIEEKLTLLAFLNSLVIEWRVRQLAANNNINFFVVRQLPIPAGADSSLYLPAAELMLADPRFIKEASLLGVVGKTDRAERRNLRNQLEALVGHRFGLSKAGFERVLASFPKISLVDRQAMRHYFCRFERPEGKI